MKPLIFTMLASALGSAYAQNPDSSAYYFSKAMTEKQAGRYQVAAGLFDLSIKHDPGNKEAYLHNGYTQLEMRRTDAAKLNFTKLHDIDPANQAAIKELTDLYYSYHQYDKAIEFASLCSSCGNSSRILGMCHYKQENYPEAEKFLLEALNKNSGDAEAAYTLARNYIDMEEYPKAVPYFDKAVKLDPTKNVWMYEQGLLYYGLNNFKAALASFKQASKAGYAGGSDFRENFGYASLYCGEYDTGEEMLLEIWKKKPANKDIFRDMAEIFYQQKQYDRSLGYCQKLMEMDMKDGKALYQAGLCFMKKGEKDRGQQMCDKAIEMDPSLENLRRKKEMVGL